MTLDGPRLRRLAITGAFAPSERGECVDEQGRLVVRELSRKRAAEKRVSRAMDDRQLLTGADPFKVNHRNALFSSNRMRLQEARIVGRGPLRRRGA
jgi:hypothetical protein